MNFSAFARKNVYRNAKAYFAYFLSSSISAALLFSFTMLILHPEFEVERFPLYLQKTLSMTTVIAYLFLCFFVFYSVSVFLKSRYKAFGVLYILGISKKQMHRMLRIENITISSGAAVVGIVVGLVFSKILLALSGKLLGYAALGFYFPVKAMFITFFAFVLIGIVISVFCSFIIKEDKVLTLLKGTKKPKPEPKASFFLAALCIGGLGTGYSLSVTASLSSISHRIIPVTSMVVIATYLLFSQFSVFLIRLLKKNKKIYMKKTTLLWGSNLLYRIKDNTRMFFLITITSAVALTSIGAIYAYWRDKEGQIDRDFPQAFFSASRGQKDSRAEFIEDALKREGRAYEKVQDEMKLVTLEEEKEEIRIIKEETYQALASTLGLKPTSFQEGETVVAADLVGEERRKLAFNTIDLKVAGKSERRVLPTLYEDVYVVKETVYEKTKGRTLYFCSFNVQNYKETLQIGKRYRAYFGDDQVDTEEHHFLKAYLLEATKIGYGVLLFSAIFIGLIFFVTTGSFLYNKCYMDVLEDKRKYRQLNKIGLTYKEIKKIVTIEIGVLFLFPYIVAMIHSFFALAALKYAFDISITTPAFLVMGSMMLVQVIYFLIIRKNYLGEVKKSLV